MLHLDRHSGSSTPAATYCLWFFHSRHIPSHVCAKVVRVPWCPLVDPRHVVSISCQPRPFGLLCSCPFVSDSRTPQRIHHRTRNASAGRDRSVRADRGEPTSAGFAAGVGAEGIEAGYGSRVGGRGGTSERSPAHGRAAGGEESAAHDGALPPGSRAERGV